MTNEPLICDWCGASFERAHQRGRIPRYCSASHRQQAHQARKRVEFGVTLASQQRIANYSAEVLAPFQRQMARIAKSTKLAHAVPDPLREQMARIAEATSEPFREQAVQLAQATKLAHAVPDPLREQMARIAEATSEPFREQAVQLAQATKLAHAVPDPLREQMARIAEMMRSVSDGAWLSQLDSIRDVTRTLLADEEIAAVLHPDHYARGSDRALPDQGWSPLGLLAVIILAVAALSYTEAPLVEPGAAASTAIEQVTATVAWALRLVGQLDQTDEGHGFFIIVALANEFRRQKPSSEG